MSSGRLFEDFVPISGTEALVTTGRTLNRLDRIEIASYRVVGDRVSIRLLEPVAAAPNVRLGGQFEGRLVYSRAGGIEGWACESKTAHQPYLYENALYYTDDWPNVRIYRDGEVFVDHFDGMIQVANPCWAGGCLYFEARADADPTRPDLWEIWRFHVEHQEIQYVSRGANPSAWGDQLFIGEWNGRNFDYRCTGQD